MCGKSEFMSTVYVFGAGASYHAGYPLASAMGGPLLNEMLKSNEAAQDWGWELGTQSGGVSSGGQDRCDRKSQRTSCSLRKGNAIREANSCPARLSR